MFPFECMLKKFILLCMIALMPLNMGFIDALRSDVKKANEQYQNEEYEAALKSYMDIQVERPGEPILDYNIGNTLYHQNRYDDAVEHYEKVILNGDGSLQAQARYNIGNSMYRKGLQSESSGNLQEAIEQMKAGLEYYKQALPAHPDDQDIKYNIEFVQNEIKRILDKAKEQQDQQQQNQQGKQQQQDQQQGKQQQQDQQQGQEQNQDQQQGQQGKQQDKTDQEKENDGQQQAVAQQDNDGQDQSDKKQQQPKKGKELTKEEAEKLLKNVPDRQKKQQQKRSKRGYLGGVERNW